METSCFLMECIIYITYYVNMIITIDLKEPIPTQVDIFINNFYSVREMEAKIKGMMEHTCNTFCEKYYTLTLKMILLNDKIPTLAENIIFVLHIWFDQTNK